MRPFYPLTLLAVAVLLFGPATTRAGVGDIYVSEDNGNIERFTPGGVESTFATGVGAVHGLAFDHSGDLFAADANTGTIYKFAADGTRTTFATGLFQLWGLACDSQGYLYAAAVTPNQRGILKFAPNGSQTTFASGYFATWGLAADTANNIYLTLQTTTPRYVYKFNPAGVSMNLGTATLEAGLATDFANNVFTTVGTGLFKILPDGTRTQLATLPETSQGLACDASGNVFAIQHNTDAILTVAPDGSHTTFASGLSSLPDAIAIQVPEPSTFALFGLCGAALLVSRHSLRRRTLRL